MILIAKIYLGLVFEMLLMLPWFILLQNIDIFYCKTLTMTPYSPVTPLFQ